jgi:hypothetical protein
MWRKRYRLKQNGTETLGPTPSRQRSFAEEFMVRWIAAACSIGLMAALSVGAAEAAKVKKKAEKVEYLRAAGSEPPLAPVRPIKKTKKAAE